MSNESIKGIFWIMNSEGDNEKVLQEDYQSRKSEINLVSIPCKQNNLSTNEDDQPEILNRIRTKLEFKGNIRLSSSGNSWNLFRDPLEQDDLSVMPV
jgi:hypothetical protein